MRQITGGEVYHDSLCWEIEIDPAVSAIDADRGEYELCGGGGGERFGCDGDGGCDGGRAWECGLRG